MKSMADDIMIRGLRREIDLQRKDSVRTVIARGKHLEDVDWNQLPVTSSSDLADDDGSFWFIVGFSLVGAGDKVRP